MRRWEWRQLRRDIRKCPVRVQLRRAGRVFGDLSLQLLQPLMLLRRLFPLLLFPFAQFQLQSQQIFLLFHILHESLVVQILDVRRGCDIFRLRS